MNRIAVYVYYDKEGEIKNYALHSIRALLDVTDKVIVVLNGEMKALEVDKLQNPKIQVIERENKGFDFWGYREGYLSLTDEELNECEELVFTNNSVFGPVFPYSELFGTMKSRNVDFWGITKHPCSNKSYNSIGLSTKIKAHIQTYFIVFRKTMITSPEFRKYFTELPPVQTKKEAINKLEINLTKHFKKLGFEYDTFVDESSLEYGVENAMQYLPDIMLEKYHNPFVKKSIFGARYDLAQRESSGNKSAIVLDFIKNKTNYDVKLITDEIIRSYSYDNILRFLNLNYILSDTHRQNFSPDKAAIIYDSSDETVNKIVEPYFKSLYGLIDIYVINRSNANFNIPGVKMKFFDNTLSYLKQIDTLSNNYSYMYFFLPDEETFASMNLVQKETFTKHVLNCSIASKYFVSNVFDTFKNNEFLGLLTPIPFIHSGFELSKKIIKNKDIEKFEKQYGFVSDISLKLLNTITPAFWITKEGFNRIDECVDFDNKEKINKGIIYTLLLLKHGLLAGRISTAFAAETYASNLEYRQLNENKFLSNLAYKIEKYFYKR